MDQELYQRIIAVYKQTGSVNRTAELCNTYAIKVRKVLITEGLWHSKKSDAVNALRERGYSAAEIAETLGMDEKNVQFYLPYTERSLSSDQSASSARVRNLRERERKTAEGNLFREEQKAGQQRKKKEFPLNGKEKDAVFRESVRTKKRRYGKELWSGYQLHIELVKNAYASEEKDTEDLFSDVENPSALRALLKTRSGISRDVIVPGKMSLHQLSYVIQELFGFMNSHLHHFSLPKTLFRQLTNGEFSKWAEMCGVYLHVPVEEDFSDLYWDDNYREGKSFKTWRRSKYIGEQKNYAVGETYIDSLRLLNDEMDWIRKNMEEKGDKRSFQDLPLDEYRWEYGLSGEINMLLERLKIEDLFFRGKLDPSDTDAWRDAMRERINISLSYLEAFRKTESFKSLEDAMGVLRMMRADRAALSQGIWRDRNKVKEFYSQNPDTVLENLEGEIQRMEWQIGDAMHVFDPPVYPVTDTLYYNYDYGDDWFFRITCKEIYSCREEDHSEDEDIKAALQKAKKHLGYRHPETEQKLESCQLGKDYMDDIIFYDSGDDELHNMFYVPLCNSYMENRPVCILTEGLPLVEDVGGANGFLDFIEKIHGEDTEEAASLRQWARSLGWREIVPKPNVLL